MVAARILVWSAALLLGAFAPAALFAGLTQTPAVLPLALAITTAHAVILGIPVTFLCWRKGWAQPISAIVGGLCIGAIPVGIFMWPATGRKGSFASINNVPTVVDGIPTWSGWLNYFEVVATCGGLGVLGASVFWLTLKMSGVLR